MEAERWQRVQDIYLDALELDAEERAAFLTTACVGDDELRREVESLLNAHQEAPTFLQTPAVVLAAEEAQRHTPPPVSPLGRRISHYQILTALGAGGMGEVYLAHDRQLGRKVALKLLPHEFTRDRERIQRFRHEARTVSSLNHPNIVTVFEIGQSEELYYIATEFIDGQTLRQQMAENSLKLSDALDVAIQTTQALTAAHEAGIVHRDIKPENIMRRRDGFVKVLDFGLAKLTEMFRSDAPTLTGSSPSVAEQVSTDPGKVVGTPRYMSPEQIRGEKVDARSDIFSLGVMLYEMIAGRPPFEGATASEVIAGILHVEPMPLARFAPVVPPELDRIVRKALRKDREARYQVVKDLQNDLKSFKEDLEFEAKLARTHRAEMPTQTMSTISAAPLGVATVVQPVAPVSAEASVRTVSSAEYIVNALTRNRRRVVLGLAGLVMLGAGLPLAWFQWWRPVASFQVGQIRKLTSAGNAGQVALAPDGKDVAYSLVEEGRHSLWLQPVDGGVAQRIVPPDEGEYVGITFSRDGKYIYYVKRGGVLYRVTRHGTDSKILLPQVSSPITLSPDGKQIAFVRRNPSQSILMTANDEGRELKELVTYNHPKIFRSSGPAWSPDGKMIACGVESLAGASFETVVGVRVADGTVEELTQQRFEDVGQLTWVGAGTGLLVTARDPRRGLPQVWSIAWPGGKTQQITNDLNAYYQHLSLTADAMMLATVQRTKAMYIWVAAVNDINRPLQITHGVQRDDGWRGLTWTADGRIVYRSSATGEAILYIVNADGKENRPLSKSTEQNLDPIVLPDGRSLAWTAGPGGQRNIWRMNLDGSNEQRLTNGDGEWFPQFTRDGKWMIYQALDKAKERLLWKKPLDGGAAEQLTHEPSYAPVLSPDDKWIACNYRSEPHAIGIAVIPITGGKPEKIFPVHGVNDRIIRWTQDSKALVYVVTKNGVSNLVSQPLPDGPTKPLTDFKELEIFNFAWSLDYKYLALSRGVNTGDVVLINALK